MTLKIVRAKDIMNTNVSLADINTTVRNAAKKLINSHEDSIVIINKDVPVGIITRGDLVRRNTVDSNSIEELVTQIMSQPLIHCRPDQSIWEVMDLMYARGIKSIPVIDEYDRLLGIINLMDMIKALSLSRHNYT